MSQIGATYSSGHYDLYHETKNSNLFEEIIDQMMLDGMDPSLQERIKNLPLRDKRLAILAFLDKDRNLFMKIKSFISKEKLSKVDHLKEVILMLREYVKVGEVEKKKFGEVMTDLNLVKHILSRIPNEEFSDPNKKFIDLANGTGVFPLVVLYRLMLGLKDVIPNEEERYKHILENQIYVSEIQPKNMFLYMCLVDPYDEYNLNIYCGSSLDNGFRNHMKSVWKVDKFSYCVGNPPFNQMIDMDFVKVGYDISDSVLFVHPSTWLLDEKGKQRKFTSTKDLIKDHLESIELFNGNGIFRIQLFVPCVITHINKNKKSIGIRCIDKINDVELTYDNVYQVNKFSDLVTYPNLKKKIENLVSDIGNVWENIRFNINKPRNNKPSIVEKNKKYNQNFSFVINLGRIRGHVDLKSDNIMLKNDFYTIIEKELKVENEINKHMFINFVDEVFAINCLKYFKSRFFSFCLSIYKNKSDIDCGELRIVPWLDFSKEWTDEKLYKEFNLTEDEIKFIEKHIPKYYE